MIPWADSYFWIAGILGLLMGFQGILTEFPAERLRILLNPWCVLYLATRFWIPASLQLLFTIYPILTVAGPAWPAWIKAVLVGLSCETLLRTNILLAGKSQSDDAFFLELTKLLKWYQGFFVFRIRRQVGHQRRNVCNEFLKKCSHSFSEFCDRMQAQSAFLPQVTAPIATAIEHETEVYNKAKDETLKKGEQWSLENEKKHKTRAAYAIIQEVGTENFEFLTEPADNTPIKRVLRFSWPITLGIVLAIVQIYGIVYLVLKPGQWAAYDGPGKRKLKALAMTVELDSKANCDSEFSALLNLVVTIDGVSFTNNLPLGKEHLLTLGDKGDFMFYPTTWTSASVTHGTNQVPCLTSVIIRIRKIL